MPLRALVDGTNTIAPQIEPFAWLSLRARKPTIILRCCGNTGYMRVSSGGLQHFYHATRSPSCPGAKESLRHLTLKAEVLKGARDAGYEAEIEASSSDAGWRADVLAIRKDTKIAFEVQLSSLGLEQLAERHARYETSGVRPAWFVDIRALRRGQLRPHFPEGDPVLSFFAQCPQPVFALSGDSVEIGSARFSLREATAKLLKGQFKLVGQRKVLLEVSASLHSFSACKRCLKHCGVFFLRHRSTLACDPNKRGFCGDSTDRGWLDHSCTPEIVAAIKASLPVDNGQPLRFSFPDWQTNSYGRSFRGFRCPHCNELIDSNVWPPLLDRGFYRHDRSLRLQFIGEVLISREVKIVDDPHWCHSVNRAFCPT